MYYHATSPVEHSSPISEATLLPYYRTEVDASLPFTPSDRGGSSLACATSQGGFLDPLSHLTGPNLAAGRSSSPPSTTQRTILHTAVSTWSDALSGDAGPSVSFLVPGSSESSAHGTQQASGNSAVLTDKYNHSMPPLEREHKTQDVFPSTAVSALTGGQPIPAGSHPEHMVLWYQMCWNAVIVNGPRKFVPQTIYQPNSQGDKERYVYLAKLHQPIIFLAQGSPEWGIPVSYLLSKGSTGLIEGDEPAFASCGPSIGIRVQWPGYRPCHKQVSTRDYTSKRRMIRKERLARVVARCIKQFMDTMSEQAMEVGSDRRWRVGPLDIGVNDIILISLHHVSQGSWQPQLRLRRTVDTSVAVSLGF